MISSANGVQEDEFRRPESCNEPGVRELSVMSCALSQCSRLLDSVMRLFCVLSDNDAIDYPLD